MVATTDAALPWLSKPTQVPHNQRPSVPTKSVHQAGATEARESSMNKPEASQAKDNGFKPFGDDGFSFLDLIDVINPLQHIPIIGPLYRDFTGDTIDPLPRIAGSTLFLGPLGAGISTADVLLEETTGKDAGEHVLAFFRDGDIGTQTVVEGPETNPQPATSGTDGEDPVTAWARQEIAYRQKLAQAQPPAAAGTDGEDPVVAWARRETASHGKLPQVQAPAASGTDGKDSVSAWAQAEKAYRTTLAKQDSPLAPPPLAAQASPVASPASNHSRRTGPAVTTAMSKDWPAARVAASGYQKSTNALKSAKAMPNTQEPTASIAPSHSIKAVRLYQKAAQYSAAHLASGATAPAGGWFADAMNGNFDRYRQMAVSAAQAKNIKIERPPAVN